MPISRPLFQACRLAATFFFRAFFGAIDVRVQSLVQGILGVVCDTSIVFVGFSDDGRLALVVRFGVAVFVLVIIVLVGVSGWRDLPMMRARLQSSMEKVSGMRWVMSAPCCTRDAPIRAVSPFPFGGRLSSVTPGSGGPFPSFQRDTAGRPHGGGRSRVHPAEPSR